MLKICWLVAIVACGSVDGWQNTSALVKGGRCEFAASYVFALRDDAAACPDRSGGFEMIPGERWCKFDQHWLDGADGYGVIECDPETTLCEGYWSEAQCFWRLSAAPLL